MDFNLGHITMPMQTLDDYKQKLESQDIDKTMQLLYGEWKPPSNGVVPLSSVVDPSIFKDYIKHDTEMTAKLKALSPKELEGEWNVDKYDIHKECVELARRVPGIKILHVADKSTGVQDAISRFAEHTGEHVIDGGITQSITFGNCSRISSISSISSLGEIDHLRAHVCIIDDECSYEPQNVLDAVTAHLCKLDGTDVFPSIIIDVGSDKKMSDYRYPAMLKFEMSYDLYRHDSSKY